MLQVDCYAARILIERFFLVATLFKQTEPGRRWQIFSGPLIDPCNFKRQLGKDLVEVITADRRDPFGSNDVVHIFIQRDKRSVKCPAAQVVNQNGFGTLSALALAMTKFDTGSTGFIEHAKHLEACVAE